MCDFLSPLDYFTEEGYLMYLSDRFLSLIKAPDYLIDNTKVIKIILSIRAGVTGQC
jgi:hypothetical protein